MTDSDQPTLFDGKKGTAESEKVILFALGEFQSRGFSLIDRELPLDRLRGAFKRAAESFGLEEFSDETIAEVLRELGANVKKLPSFVAKHPFRITVDAELAIRASEAFRSEQEKEKEDQ